MFKDFFNKAVSEHNLIDRSKLNYREFEDLALTANKMIVDSLKVEASLKESEENYRFLYERNPASMLIYERNTYEIISVNEAFIKHYGYAEEEMLEMLLPDLYPYQDRDRLIEFAKGLHGLARAGEWKHIKKGWLSNYNNCNVPRYKFSDRNARVAVIFDITERKKGRRRNKSFIAKTLKDLYCNGLLNLK